MSISRRTRVEWDTNNAQSPFKRRAGFKKIDWTGDAENLLHKLKAANWKKENSHIPFFKMSRELTDTHRLLQARNQFSIRLSTLDTRSESHEEVGLSMFIPNHVAYLQESTMSQSCQVCFPSAQRSVPERIESYMIRVDFSIIIVSSQW